MAATTIYTARKIVTMNPSNPVGTAVAVRDGRVLAVGSLQDCQAWGEATIDGTFENKVLIPGFVEAHGHTAGAVPALMPYVGYFDYPMHDGTVAKGLKSYDELIAKLKEIDASLPAGEILIANGFDPIYFVNDERLSKKHLDAVSTSRQIFVRHASGHLATVNSVVLTEEGITSASTTPGVAMGPDGEPNGELQEAPAMGLATKAMTQVMGLNGDPRLISIFGQMCRNAGVTTSTELVGTAMVMPQTLASMHSVVDADDYPARIVNYNVPVMPGTTGADWNELAAQAIALRDSDTAKVRNGGIKLVLDGSIQGWTAVMLWPGYITGEDQGLLLTTPEELLDMMRAFHGHRIQVHAHANGNGAAGLFIDTVDKVLSDYAWLDHRHVVQHAQTVTQYQIRRMAKLGLAANVFTNHIAFWGDQHYAQTLGPDRTRGMWPCRSLLDAGVSTSFHSDSGVTPIGHLMTMWCAVNRVADSGTVLGEEERITPYEALKAATLGGAYQCHMDDEIGSIEPGKLADFAVLDESPLDVKPTEIKDIPVWGTVLGGVPFAAPAAS